MIELITYRIYGQPKIHKPKVLKNIRPAFSQEYHKRKNQVYIVGNDVYVYFFDLFSKLHGFPEPEDASLPASALQKKYPDAITRNVKGKFVYPDAWCPILDRNEGYVKFSGLIQFIRNTDYLPATQFRIVEEFMALSLQDDGFEKMNYLEGMGNYVHDLARFIGDMVGELFVMIRDGKL